MRSVRLGVFAVVLLIGAARGEDVQQGAVFVGPVPVRVDDLLRTLQPAPPEAAAPTAPADPNAAPMLVQPWFSVRSHPGYGQAEVDPPPGSE
ncbi:MAG TPA: hypothetical protein VFD84_06495 [Candidatus Binatia bacterium]|nr:hypothetical protein [Candidatus Binatia bacterium]